VLALGAEGELGRGGAAQVGEPGDEGFGRLTESVARSEPSEGPVQADGLLRDTWLTGRLGTPNIVDLMPTPVGAAQRDPHDPDFWDWGDDDEPALRRHPTRAAVAVIVILALVVLVVISVR
jgi:hypothetical protein